jgi:hypothetical protein
MAVLYTQHFVQFFDDNGNPLSGGKLYTYDAGGTTPKATYTDAAGTTPNANPVVLDAAGRATVFLDGTTYRFDLKTSGDVLVRSTDNVQSFGVVLSNVPNSSLALMPANTVKVNATALSATPQDLAIPTNSFIYRGSSNITTLPIAAAQVVGATDAGVPATLGMGNGLQISGSILQQRVRPAFQATRLIQQSVTSGVLTKVLFNTEAFDTNNCYDATLARFTPNVAGYYFINAAINAFDNSGGAAFALQICIYKNGNPYVCSRTSYADNSASTISVSNIVPVNGTTDFIEIYAQLNNVTLIEAFDNSFYGWLTNIA